MASKAKQDEPSQAAAPPTAGPHLDPHAGRGRAARRLLFGGVAAACVMGVGLGLWARPEASERRLALTSAHPAAPTSERPRPTLQIVVDGRAPAPPKPAAAPVLAADHPIATGFAPADPAEPVAPRRPPEGLVKVQAVTAPAATPAPAPQPDLIARAAAAQKRQAAEAAAQARADADAARQKAAAEKLVAARAARAEKLAAQKAAHAQAMAKQEAVARAKAERAEAAKAAALEARRSKLAKAKADAARKAEQIRLAKAEAAAQAAEKARQTRVAALAHKLALAMEHRKDEAAAARRAAQLAEAKAERMREARAEQARLEKAALKRRQDAAVAAQRKAAQKKAIRGEGPLRLASNHCASADPAQALICADSGLAAADRQMNRVYHQAEAAGVPAWRLRQQQQRWLQARAAAAREAPWAVHDVYVARIAELQDQTRSAGGAGY